jgi:biopolymer transport protein ExbB/TolQ
MRILKNKKNMLGVLVVAGVVVLVLAHSMITRVSPDGFQNSTASSVLQAEMNLNVAKKKQMTYRQIVKTAEGAVMKAQVNLNQSQRDLAEVDQSVISATRALEEARRRAAMGSGGGGGLLGGSGGLLGGAGSGPPPGIINTTKGDKIRINY